MEALKQRGNALYAQKKYDEALEAYNEALCSLPAAAEKADCDNKVRMWGGLESWEVFPISFLIVHGWRHFLFDPSRETMVRD